MEKTLRSIETIGPAVFNGGLTTFLALTLSGGSTSHTFKTFFKVRSYLHKKIIIIKSNLRCLS